jgi:hypothetical protein
LASLALFFWLSSAFAADLNVGNHAPFLAGAVSSACSNDPAIKPLAMVNTTSRRIDDPPVIFDPSTAALAPPGTAVDSWVGSLPWDGLHVHTIFKKVGRLGYGTPFSGVIK